jgi:hypothetical protein
MRDLAAYRARNRKFEEITESHTSKHIREDHGTSIT